MTDTRSFDVVLYGATGFTGRLAALYLANYNQNDTTFKWALAGRSESKLEELRNEISKKNSSDITILVADCNDSAALEITSQCKCILNFAGPYTKYGEKVLESCVDNGCHYVDLTGELGWVKRMMDKLEQRAVENKVRVIHVSGFDSVPSDLATLLVTLKIKQEFNVDTLSCSGLWYSVKGGMSGGTLASMQEMMKPENVEEYLKMKSDPQYYNPVDLKTGLDEADLQYPRWFPEFGRWGSGFIMSPLNVRVVRRSNALLGYGKEFTYTEGMMNYSYLRAKSSCVLNNTLTSATSFSFVRSLLGRYGPQPGQGPDPKTFDKSGFCLKVAGRPVGDAERVVMCTVSGKGDPGYQLTARMMVEAGLCIALKADGLPDRVGFLTPASGIGVPYADRLEKYAGITFKTEVVDGPSSG